MYEIQTNEKGSKHMFITDAHLYTIEKYALFHNLIDSSGIINEMVLDKLKMNVRSIMEGEKDNEELINLCKDVLFHENMKAYGLNQLVKLFNNWLPNRHDPDETDEEGLNK